MTISTKSDRKTTGGVRTRTSAGQSLSSNPASDSPRKKGIKTSVTTDAPANASSRLRQMLRAGTHNPDFSFPVIRRRITAELLDLACMCAGFLCSGGRNILRPMFAPRGAAVDLAARRLAKSGLIAYRRPRGQSPVLTITSEGQSRVSSILWPERFWNRRWDSRWYVLMYDVPEKERSYRRALEEFFRRERMGCLQKSVWISARDIRPLFDDMDQAAAIRNYAVLFEATPVLGQSSKQVAAQAWNFEWLAKRQASYISACMQRMNQAQSSITPLEALDSARSELFEYCDLMTSDPLLPSELLPKDYAGPQVVAAFRSRIGSLAGRLFSL
jgi:phenylacetic acid degradation operon negative regulatory protein